MSHLYLYIPNSDGSVRWIWSIESKEANFLNFYNASTLKQKIFHLTVQMIFLLRIQTLVFRKTNEIELGTIPKDKEWALFYGTPGPNNKKILFKKDENGKVSFTKIAKIESAIALIEKEKVAINTLTDHGKNFYFLFPEIISKEKSGELVIGNIPFTKSLPKWNRLHTAALNDLAKINATKSKVEHWPGWKHINNQISELSHIGSAKIPLSILNKLILLKIDVNRNIGFEFHQAHGDFTPWNTYLSKDKIAVIDWEFAMNSASKGYDFFHFHVQNGILVEKKSATEIIKTITKNGLSNEIFTSIKELKAYFNLYLLQHISYYSLLYSKQEYWHTQINWQLAVWEELLNEMIYFWDNRKLFLIDLMEYLKTKTYAGLKLHSGRPEELNEFSDIDLVVKKSNIAPLLKWIRSRGIVREAFSKKRSNMSAITIEFKDGTRLHLDLISQLKRKALEFMNASDILAHSKTNQYGIKEANPKDTATFIGLFYGLNGSPVPRKYSQMADNLLPMESDMDIALYKHYLNTPGSSIKLVDLVKKRSQNKGIKGLKNRINYTLDSFNSFFKRKGMIITLSGVDGAGKTTVINELVSTFDKKFRKPVIVLRHRPSIVPILSSFKYGKMEAEKRSVASLPRQGENQSKVTSLLRFAYYYSDYFIGQFFIYMKYVLRGYIVIYDRYYFDIINDSKRSNMNLPKSITSLGYKFLLKPNYNFFLYANPDVILERKQELDRETISELTYKYKVLFSKLQGKRHVKRYVAINNEVLDKTTQRILQTIGNIY